MIVGRKAICDFCGSSRENVIGDEDMSIIQLIEWGWKYHVGEKCGDICPECQEKMRKMKEPQEPEVEVRREKMFEAKITTCDVCPHSRIKPFDGLRVCSLIDNKDVSSGKIPEWCPLMDWSFNHYDSLNARIKQMKENEKKEV